MARASHSDDEGRVRSGMRATTAIGALASASHPCAGRRRSNTKMTVQISVAKDAMAATPTPHARLNRTTDRKPASPSRVGLSVGTTARRGTTRPSSSSRSTTSDASPTASSTRQTRAAPSGVHGTGRPFATSASGEGNMVTASVSGRPCHDGGTRTSVSRGMSRDGPSSSGENDAGRATGRRSPEAVTSDHCDSGCTSPVPSPHAQQSVSAIAASSSRSRRAHTGTRISAAPTAVGVWTRSLPLSIMAPVQPGTLVANRFEIERLAGAGGMGAVYRAIDRESGAPVALKLLTRGGVDRFLREARVLAELAHPHIVRHVAHGVLPGGDPYLAMEWLDGEELSRRLQRGPLSVAESIVVARAVAEALGAAHARGVVHRDLKPANLFLVDGDVARLRVLDFGAALVETAAAPTATGIVLGTPGYMAPEQVRGDRGLDARADVFALGCVLYECLTGGPAFVAQHVLALLGKILLEEPPPLRDRVPDAPPALEELVRRMLSKEPDGRPAGGAELVRELDALAPLATPPAAQSSRQQSHVTERERRLVTIVMAVMPAEVRVAEAARTRVRALAARVDAQAEPLGEGSMIVVLTARGTARDQAAAAARCALDIARELPDAQVVVATGRGEISTLLPIGEVMERAATLVSSGGEREPGRPRLDEATAALLDARFDIARRADGSHVLVGAQASETVRTVFGRPSPYVGRDKEIALLVATFDECAAERAARAVLVVGEAGLGK